MRRSALAILIVLIFVGVSYSQEGHKERIFPGVNPHDHINDEGEILYYKCVFCHGYAPDPIKDKSIDMVKFRVDDLRRKLCFKCHPERMHPGGGFIAQFNPRWGKFGAPNHWVIPPKYIKSRMDESVKKFNIILPLDPSTGEVTCPTCHNPHERGLLFGPPGYGADDDRRLRDSAMSVCQYCHAK
jgi:hypothetical protein